MADPIQIPLPLGMTYPTVNAYLFRQPEPVLVDGGLNTDVSEQALAAALHSHGLTFADLRQVVVTHPHVDHVGLAGKLAAHGAAIWLSDLAWDWMADLVKNRAALTGALVDLMAQHGFAAQAQALLAAYYDGLGPLYAPLRRESVRIFKAGEHLEFGGRPWRAINAPGHSNRQVCFFQEADGRLLSADMLLPKTPAPVVEQTLAGDGRRQRGLPQLIESYAVFRALDASRVFPGHGEPFDDHRALIDRQLRRIARRKSECLALVRSGCDTLPALLDKMYAYMPPHARLGGLAMLIGYLDLLAEEGMVREAQEGGLRKFVALEP